MQRATLLMSLALIVNSSAALAATPVFRVDAQNAGTSLQAIDSYSPRLAHDSDSALTGVRSEYAPFSSSAAVASIAPKLTEVSVNMANDRSADAYGDAHIVPASYSRGAGARNAAAAGPLQTSVVQNTSGDSLFYFIKHFRARPLQKPASGTMLLVALCFVLYQVRRRPMRSSIGFHAAAKLIGQHGA